jgi:hypothetical protein
VLGLSTLNRVGTRRILTCPYCDRLQYILPRPAAFVIGCRNCHRAFRVIEMDTGQAAVRADETPIIPMRRPGRCVIGRRIEPAGGVTKRALPRSPGGRLRRRLRWLGAPWVFPWVLAAAAATVHVLLTIFGNART